MRNPPTENPCEAEQHARFDGRELNPSRPYTGFKKGYAQRTYQAAEASKLAKRHISRDRCDKRLIASCDTDAAGGFDGLPT